MQNSTGLIICIFFQETTSVNFLTEDNIQDFIDRLNLIHQEVLIIGKATFGAEIVSALIVADIQSEVSPLLARNTFKN